MSFEPIVKFVSELKDHFSPPRHGSAEAEARWLRNLVEALRGASPTVLDRAKRNIIDTRKNRYFPLIGEIREACREAAREVEFDAHVQTLPALRQATSDEWSTERCKLAYDLVKCELGRQAAKEGWILALWHHCRRHQRLPQSQTEIAACKRISQEFDQSYANCVTGRAGPQSRTLEALGSSMLAKRKKLAEEVMGR